MKNFFQKILLWWKTERLQKNEINYLYYSFMLVFLGALSVSHSFYLDAPLSGIPLFFLLQGLGQAVLEVFFLVMIAFSIKHFAPKWAYLAWISFSFILLLAHFTDYTMIRLMDASLSYVFNFLFGSGMGHLVAGLRALNFNTAMIGVIIGSIIAIPLVGLGFFWITGAVSNRKPLRLSFNQVATVAFSIVGGLLILDLLVHPFLNRNIYTKYQKTLPFGTTFLAPEPVCIALNGRIKGPRVEKEMQKRIPATTIEEKPNIYLFVVETFRRDFVNGETAPHLTEFGRKHGEFKGSFSNANATHLSWFSIFHSDFPYHWTAMRGCWQEGSIPLQWFKKLGYKIRVYSGADLRLYNMDRMIFGQHLELIDQLVEFDGAIEPCHRDAMALASFERDLDEMRQGNLILFFLDSTHSEYNFPSDFPLKFEPISKEIDYLSLSPKSPKLELMKNRYKNSIHYVDHLFGRFFQTLREKKLYDEAIIAITGDHGEEFYEEGALFHGTHLNRYQISVPLLMKFPEKRLSPMCEEVSHLDIFPSILHYLTGSDSNELFDGQSVFKKDRWPYRIAVLNNGPLSPSDFMMERGKEQIRARFSPQIYDQSDIEIVDRNTGEESCLQAFAPLLERR